MGNLGNIEGTSEFQLERRGLKYIKGRNKKVTFNLPPSKPLKTAFEKRKRSFKILQLKFCSNITNGSITEVNWDNNLPTSVVTTPVNKIC